MKKMKQRFMSILLIVALCLTLSPVTALALDADTDPSHSEPIKDSLEAPMEEQQKVEPEPTVENDKPDPESTQEQQKGESEPTVGTDKPDSKPAQEQQKGESEPTEKTEKPDLEPTQESQNSESEPTEKTEKPGPEPTQESQNGESEPTEKTEKPDSEPTQEPQNGESESTVETEKPDSEPTQEPQKGESEPKVGTEKPDSEPTQEPQKGESEPTEKTEKPDSEPTQESQKGEPEPLAEAGEPDPAPSTNPEARFRFSDDGTTWNDDSWIYSDYLINAPFYNPDKDNGSKAYASAKYVQIELLRDITTNMDWNGGATLATGDGQEVVLDGGGHTITRGAPTQLFTVCGIYGSARTNTVTLKNITLDGGAVWSSDDPVTRTNSGISCSGNAHLINVTDNGELILDSGTVLKNSHLNGERAYGAAVSVGSTGTGTLVMKDGSQITDNTVYCGAVYVWDNGAFNMEGGIISGNYGANNGGAVCMGGGSFTMSGGSITGNGSYAGGGVSVFNSGAQFTISGGEISGNIITGRMGGGVLVYNGSMSVSGSPVINGNTGINWTANNVYLTSGHTITANSLSSGAKIGVNPASYTSSIDVTNANSEDYSGYFISDNKAYNIKNITTDNGNIVTLRLARPFGPVITSFSSDIEKVTVAWKIPIFLGGDGYSVARYEVSSNGGEEWTSIGIPTKLEYTFTDLEAGTDYTFKVRAICSNTSGKTLIGGAAEIIAAPKTVITTAVDPEEGGTATGGTLYEKGAKVTVEATPASGYCFVSWMENDEEVSPDASYTFTAGVNRTLTAVFAREYTVSVSANSSDYGTVTGGGTYQEGESVIVTATPIDGYRFVNWTENNEEVSPDASYTFTVEADRTLTAVFEKISDYTVTVSADPQDGGTVTGGGTYQEGESVIVTATPMDEYRFVNWTENNEEVSPDASYTFTVESDRTLTAVFEKITNYTVTVSANPQEGGTVTGGGTYQDGTSVTVTATVKDGYRFLNWTEDGNNVSTDANYNFNVMANRTLTAVFEQIPDYTITVSANLQDGGTVTGGGTYRDGTSVTVTATPAGGYSFVNWTENDNEVSPDASYTFTAAESRSLIAVFKAITVSELTISPTTLIMAEGRTKEIKVDNIQPSNALDKTVSWLTSDGSVAKVVKVDGTDFVIAVGEGKATITATAGDAVASCEVTVNPVSVAPVRPPELPQDTEEKKLKVEVETGLSEVPTTLATKEELNTLEKIETKMKTTLTSVSVPKENTAVYDVSLMVSTDGGKEWVKADKDNFPSNGLLTTTLPYPEGTDSSYTFTVVHMFTTSDFGKVPGDTETLPVTNLENCIQFTVHGLSPISVGWTAPKFIITFESSNGTDAKTYTTESNGKLYSLPPDPTWNGYTFKGWYTAASGGNPVTADTVFNEDATVYAQWEAVNPPAPEDPSEPDEPEPPAHTLSGGSSPAPSYSGSISSGNYTPAPTTPSNGSTHAPVTEDTPNNTDNSSEEVPFSPGPDDTSNNTENPDEKVPAETSAFTDVNKDAWYSEAVDYVLSEGLMDGYGNGTFGPDEKLSRAQFCQILYNREGRPTVTGTYVFSDVAQGEWYTDAVLWANTNGTVTGYGGDKFGPNDFITREQLAVMLWRYVGSPNAEGGALSFSDADKISSYALEAIKWANANGIINGYSNSTFNPKGTATRAQAAQMLKNFFELAM